jgi:2-iminobutanoate/2-iminopropanoate deaminase
MNAMSNPIGPYTPVVRAGELLFVSGQVGLADGQMVSGGVEAETRRALANMASLLEAEGASLADVVKTTVFLRHMRDYSIMNEAYTDVFGEHRPARSCVAVVELPAVALVEIEAVALAPDLIT